MPRGGKKERRAKAKTSGKADGDDHMTGAEDLKVGVAGVASAAGVGDDSEVGVCEGDMNDIRDGIGSLGDGTEAVMAAATSDDHDGVVGMADGSVTTEVEVAGIAQDGVDAILGGVGMGPGGADTLLTCAESEVTGLTRLSPPRADQEF